MPKKSLFFSLNFLALIGAIAVSISLGSTHIQDLVAALIHPSASTTGAEILWQIRIPRIVTALLIGAALGAAGAVAQGATNNPLAEPTILGTSAGAAMAVVIGVVTNFITIGSAGAMAIATIGALSATLLTFYLAALNRQVSSFNLIIIGLSISATISAIVGILTTAITRADARSISFWSFGSLALTSSSDILPLAIFVFAGIVIALMIAPNLDVLSLGDLTAKHLGVDLRKVRLISLFAISILIGAAVSTVGTIAFLGLAAPHIVRLVSGPKHQRLIIQSALVGSTILLIADTLARTIAKPNELNVGLFTALIGAPVLAILVRSRKTSWSQP